MYKNASSKLLYKFPKKDKEPMNNMKLKKVLKDIENNLPELYDEIESVLMESRSSGDRFDDEYADWGRDDKCFYFAIRICEEQEDNYYDDDYSGIFLL